MSTTKLTPIVRPVIGAYVNYQKDWRWVEWTLIFFTVFALVFSVFTKETYKKIILKRRAKAAGVLVPTGTTDSASLKRIMTVVLLDQSICC